MAITAQRITASSTPVALNAKSLAALPLTVTNASANPAADPGGANVTAGTGYSLPAGATVSLQLNAVMWSVRFGRAHPMRC